MMIDPN
jgi:lysyl-tRNA synthetase class 2